MSLLSKDFWCVYRHTSPNGKVYVGITNQAPDKRWQGGRGYKRGHFNNAILKYGWNSITHHYLSYESGEFVWNEYKASTPRDLTNLFTEAEAKSLEMLYIEKYQSHLPSRGYNRTLGGEAEIPTIETRKQMSETRIALWTNESFRSRMTGRNSAFWKDFDEPAFSYLDQNNNATLKELASHVGCCKTTAFALRQQWLDKNPGTTVLVDRSKDKNPNYRNLDNRVFEYLDANPQATAAQIQSAVGCSECTALEYRKQWRKAKDILAPKLPKERIYELLDQNPEMMLKDLMVTAKCCETTASRYRKQWQQDHPNETSRRNQSGKHNPNYKGIEKQVYAFLDRSPDASLKEIMSAVSCGEGSAVKYRKAWRLHRAN